ATCCVPRGWRNAWATSAGTCPSSKPSTSIKTPARVNQNKQPAPSPSPIEVFMPAASAAGRSSPLGATIADGGVNFSLFSRTATGVELLLFDRDAAGPARAIRLNPATNHTYHYWHAFVPGVKAGQLYGYRVEGPAAPDRGLRFDPTKVLLDPYGRGVVVP